jgi:hypothetical protein
VRVGAQSHVGHDIRPFLANQQTSLNRTSATRDRCGFPSLRAGLSQL